MTNSTQAPMVFHPWSAALSLYFYNPADSNLQYVGTLIMYMVINLDFIHDHTSICGMMAESQNSGTKMQ
jgi:hypothetical protein